MRLLHLQSRAVSRTLNPHVFDAHLIISLERVDPPLALNPPCDMRCESETLERLSPVGEEGDMCILERVDTDTMGKELRKR